MHGNQGDLFRSVVKNCACNWAVGSGLSLRFATSLPYFWSETLEFGRSHITYQDVRHASWGSIECDLCRKCNSSVKV